MKPNDTIFIVSLKIGKVVRGKLIKKINKDKFEIVVEYPEGNEIISVLHHQIYINKKDAEKKLCALIHDINKKKLSSLVKGNTNFLPKEIAELDGIYHSGNPLRFGEPQIVAPIQSNVVSEYDNPQKILQLIGAIWEDIEMLQHILFVLSYSNEYTKKLIGKYIIIELRSLSSSFKRLNELDDEYKDLYQDFIVKAKKLDDEFKFGVVSTKTPVIRNKISAHRDSNLDLVTAIELWAKITRYNIHLYLDVFSEHINNLLKKYPFETKMYFTMRKEPYRSLSNVSQPKDNPYQPFDQDLFTEK